MINQRLHVTIEKEKFKHMKKHIAIILLLASCFLLSCNKKTCPAYGNIEKDTIKSLKV